MFAIRPCTDEASFEQTRLPGPQEYVNQWRFALFRGCGPLLLRPGSGWCPKPRSTKASNPNLGSGLLLRQIWGWSTVGLGLVLVNRRLRKTQTVFLILRFLIVIFLSFSTRFHKLHLHNHILKPDIQLWREPTVHVRRLKS